MIYLVISNGLIAVCFIFYAYLSERSKNKLIELLAAKDYADYKNFEQKTETRKDRDRKNMFNVRNSKENRFKEQE